jgi:hypothetical protein
MYALCLSCDIPFNVWQTGSLISALSDNPQRVEGLAGTTLGAYVCANVIVWHSLKCP